jgi:hypothetical protein
MGIGMIIMRIRTRLRNVNNEDYKENDEDYKGNDED